jgi:hypothetical protein
MIFKRRSIYFHGVWARIREFRGAFGRYCNSNFRRPATARFGLI